MRRNREELKRWAKEKADGYFADQCERMGPIGEGNVTCATVAEADKANREMMLRAIEGASPPPINLNSSPEDFQRAAIALNAKMLDRDSQRPFYAGDMFPPGEGMRVGREMVDRFRL